MPQYPIPVVVVSSVSDNVFDALNAGAVDFVTKPDFNSGKGIDSLINELIIKIKIASTAKVGHLKKEISSNNFNGISKSEVQRNIIAIGASTGGTEAIFNVIKMFPRDMPGIVIVQHMPPVFTKMYAERLNNSCLLEVKEAQSGDKVVHGRVLIAPGEFHMKIKKVGSEYIVDCFKADKVNGHCPSVDVLFNSVAEHVGKNAIGVILTGMGNDGAKGLLEMRNRGARTIGQDEQSSIVYGMPKVAYDIGAVQEQHSLDKIAQAVYSYVSGN
jgi:two-component system, chemotaxis family, protein-glutamate methylesterase/glutaminase